ncbi:proteobacterial dedicated sortase system histidine kinase [Lacimicrobium alkaliphilum]|uniref:histidine kinase n=1 Tax=Lacimicrobium alkaliphilum TaxID=1526571 RepID=A0ABQ1R8S2_9ALTE|nr:proteobacterial dedicated sortase system histidine kinase [Lacimicrobium alkaliphilum]GGD59479.1 proteobacterial dedicated sortase system histidine kinase [Lacimicrobium alkaliphilum]
MSRRTFVFGLRAKLVLMSLFLFAIPWLGYEYVWEMEKYLRAGQERTLLGTVRAVATALHERPRLFDAQASYLSVEKGRDLYAYPIVDPIHLDGRLNDWRQQQHALRYDDTYLIDQSAGYRQGSLTFKHMVGKYRNYLYAYFEVFDEQIVYRPENSLRVDKNDHLQIAFTTPAGDFRRYLIATTGPGWLTPYELDTGESVSGVRPLKPEPRIQGSWAETQQGYNVELRIPLELLGSKLSFAITDVDQSGEEPVATIGTSDVGDADTLGTVLVPSPEIEQIIRGLGHTDSRIWVVDRHQRVLARSGDIRNSDGIWSRNVSREQEQGWFARFERQWLHPLYYKFLTRPPKDFIDQFYDVAELQGSHIEQALGGEPGSDWRLTPDNKAVVLAAAYPIFIEDQVMGAVIAEETTNGIRSLRNLALEKLFTLMLAIMLLGTLGLFLLASRISTRIRRLRDQSEQAIDEQGRLRGNIQPSRASDEIGDLSRSFADMVQRLGQYHHYLENMSSRLSHELRTPVAVVRSSLETLSMEDEGAAKSVYMQRAQEGLNRLSAILTNMSEATRLEQSLQSAERHKFDLAEVVKGCMQGYELAYAARALQADIRHQPLELNGAPELIAQLLDKLIANAVEFARPDTPVVVSLSKQPRQAVLEITNQGPQLPQEMAGRLFDSMVSVRPGGKGTGQPHLGLGLYIARLIVQFHQGQIQLTNLEDGSGVCVRVSLPI